MEDGRMETILSQEGTQQGDAAGPFLFCLGLQPALVKLQEEFPDDFVGAFMDDIDGGLDETRITVLGCPLGGASFVQSSLEKITTDHQPLLEAIVTFAQMGLQGSGLLLRYCASPRLEYWLRLLPPDPDVSLAAAERHDAAIITAFRRMFRFPGDFTDSVSAQVQLPIRLGGFGLISRTTIARAAFLSSIGVTASDVFARFRGAPWMPYGGLAALLDLPWLQAAVPALTAVSEVVGPSFSLPSLQDLVSRPQVRLKQRLTDQLHKFRFNELFNSVPPDGRARARLLSCQGPLSSGWLSAIPSSDSKALNNFQYRHAVAGCLGISLPRTTVPQRCICDGEVDKFGDHFYICHTGHVPSNVEVPLHSLGITPPDDNANNQRMDIYCVIDGSDYLLDVTIAHPCRPDNSPIPFHRTVNRRSAQLPGGKTAQLAEKDKIDKYGPTARAAGFRFVPLAAETFGRWGEKTMDFLKMLAKRKPRPTSIPTEEDTAFRESIINH
ncbi:unnamed protein product [Vitrella brassicaformis CCMP3155]|uniref:Reverse transcriptase domain-containing protein n=1 Tax=Vitrella brassicaformis (strain CCMP3155) TaxID=1169540 RepID=A0A0G4GVH9_VITBC|nr:unnamed protein product [Vitrella brassicaformis CCMP3155]|eukprot:CEM34897.1 unnamed protein product [Vitrella brassicaformis CCMP3155]